MYHILQKSWFYDLHFLEHELKHSEGELGSLKSSMHPELVKYAKETEQKNTSERKLKRQKIFQIFPDFQSKVCSLYYIWVGLAVYYLPEVTPQLLTF